MKLPPRSETLNYFDTYHVPSNVRSHCLKVEQVALFLAQELQNAGENVDVELVSRLALFHDMFKAAVLEELKPNEFHPHPFTEQEISSWKALRKKYAGKFEVVIAADILQQEYPEFAHILLQAGDPIMEKKQWEAKIMHYADWRVQQEKIVLLSERLQYLQQKYKPEANKWKKSCALIQKIEQEIFAKLSYQPSQLQETLNG